MTNLSNFINKPLPQNLVGVECNKSVPKGQLLTRYTIRSKNKFGLAKHLVKMIHNIILGCKEYFTNQSKHKGVF